MPWAVELADGAVKAIDNLDTKTRHQIQRFIKQWLLRTDNPRQRGETLTGRYAGLWKYRIGDYRLICRIEDARRVVLVVKVARRDTVYKGKPPK